MRARWPRPPAAASMPRMLRPHAVRPRPLAARVRLVRLGVLALVFLPLVAAAHPASDLEVGDALEDEVRILDLYPGAGAPARFHTRPLVRAALFADSTADSTGGPLAFPAALARLRIDRALWRDRPGPPAPGPRGATPYLVRADDVDSGARFELSAGVEGTWFTDPDTSRFLDRSGLHLRGAMGIDHWLVQAHWVVGQIDHAREFADPIVAGRDLLATADQALIAYHADDDRWGARFGRQRFHWGPGRAGAMILSETSAPLTALEFHGAIAHGRLSAVAVSATLAPGAGRQLAAHRIEWQARDGLRLGVSEAAVYHAPGWRPLYLAGLLPYTVAQRLDAQDEPDSASTLRNNVMVAADGSWRIAPGTRVYAEALIDDLHAKTGANPDKLGFLVGWDGAGVALGTRLSWNGEYARLTRFVYTSFFGAEAVAQGRPIGYPTGPDSHLLTLSLACDPNEDFQLSLDAERLEQGESGLDVSYTPGPSSPPDPWSHAGVVETARAIGAGLRWWPAAGIDLGVHGAYRKRENADHVAGRTRDGGEVSVVVRLSR